jgi:WD40 repeat protein
MALWRYGTLKFPRRFSVSIFTQARHVGRLEPMTLHNGKHAETGTRAEPATDGLLVGEGLSFSGLTAFGAGVVAGSDPLTPGMRLGDVAIIRFIAAGGMGRVYEGLQGMPCRTVAVKLIHPGVLSPSAARRFEHEAHILGRLNHPGIAKIFSVGMQDVAGRALPYFVMEFIEDARAITAHADGLRLAVRRRVELFREVCQAVAHGHHKGIVHRDLKPGNILVDAAGQPKIIDFGVARSTDGDVALTTMHTDVGHIVGTLQYMSPEQFEGDADEIDLRSDVYSLGLVLYELLAGRPPYEIAGKSVYEAARIVKETDPGSMTAMNVRLPRDLATIVTKCLEKDRGRRYSSAGEVEADLGRFLRGEPILARPVGLVESLVKLARRYRFAAATAAGITGSLMLALVGISLFAARAERQRRVAVAAREKADSANREATAHLYVANLRALQTALQTGNTEMARQVYRENAAIAGAPLPLEMRCLGVGLDEALVVLEPEHGDIREVAFSVDGRTLRVRSVPNEISEFKESPGANEPADRLRERYLHRGPDGLLEDCAIWAFQLFQGSDGRNYQPLQTDDSPRGGRWQAAFSSGSRMFSKSDRALVVSPDGRRTAVQTLAGIEVIDRATGGVIGAMSTGRGRLQAAGFSPDGSRLLTQDARGAATLWDVETGQPLGKPHDGTAEAFRFSPDGRRLALLINMSTVASHCDVLLCDARDGSCLTTLALPMGVGFLDTLLEFNPDGTWLATSSREKSITVWRVKDGSVAARLRVDDGIVTAIAFGPDGHVIAAGTQSGVISTWDPQTESLIGKRIGHEAAVTSLAFHPAGTTIASGIRDGTIRIWDAGDGAPRSWFAGLTDVTAVCFRPDGEQIALAPRGTGRIELWNPRTMERDYALEDSNGIINDIAYATDGRHVAAAVGAHDGPGEVRVWDVASGRCLARLGDHEAGASTVVFSPDGSRLLTRSGARAANVMLWDWGAGRRLLVETVPLHARFRDGGANYTTAVFGAGGSRVVCGKARAWDGRTGQPVAEMPRTGMVTAMAVGPGSLTARGTVIGKAYIDDCQRGEVVATLLGHARSVVDIAFTQDGQRVVTASDDGTARVWDVATGELQHVLRAHDAAVEKILLTPDDRRIVTASSDGTVRIWDASSGRELCSLPGSRETPRAIAIDSSGMRLVAAGNGTVRIWGLSNAAVISARRAAAEHDVAALQARPETPPDRLNPAD